MFYNHSDKAVDIKKGQHAAQLILEKCSTPEVAQVDQLDDTKRGSMGFGSTDSHIDYYNKLIGLHPARFQQPSPGFQLVPRRTTPHLAEWKFRRGLVSTVT